MKCLVLIAAVIFVAQAATDKDQWLQFKQQHGRNYRNLIEEQQRFSIFQQNLRTIEEHNEKYARGEKSYYFGVTPFADLTKEEFLVTLGSHQPHLDSLQNETLGHVLLSEVPSAIDWRDEGILSEVKNQGNCGSCWAFGATGALEAAYAIKTGELISLSEQNLIDCSSSYGNNGCTGGTMHAAFKYVVAYGIETEEDYAYKAKVETCAFSSSLSVLKASKYVTLTKDSESTLQKAVGTIGPVAVSIDATNLQLYSGGIFDDETCTSTVNHGVLVVGYGETNGTEYWIIKNSWGASWGEEGYGKMVRNKNDQCGIALWGVYPVL